MLFQDENTIITRIYWAFASLKFSFPCINLLQCMLTYPHNNLMGEYIILQITQLIKLKYTWLVNGKLRFQFMMSDS